jgi:NADH-quinone oxidoreductase subunit A
MPGDEPVAEGASLVLVPRGSCSSLACHPFCTALKAAHFPFFERIGSFGSGAAIPAVLELEPDRLPPAGKAAMSELLQQYLPLVVFIGVALVIVLALLVLPFLVAYQQPDPEKLSAYECGFNAFDDARMKFDVRFYLVAILFIIFDLEVSFLFPWAVAFGRLGAFGFWSMMVFLGVLTVGFIYEWKKGALEWD